MLGTPPGLHVVYQQSRSLLTSSSVCIVYLHYATNSREIFQKKLAENVFPGTHSQINTYLKGLTAINLVSPILQWGRDE